MKARALALRRRRSSGWPTSIQWTIRPVRSFCQSSGSSGSQRPFANSSAPSRSSPGTLRANASSLMMIGVYLGLNLSAHYDIDLRQGLRLGAGLSEWEPRQEPVPA